MGIKSCSVRGCHVRLVPTSLEPCNLNHASSKREYIKELRTTQVETSRHGPINGRKKKYLLKVYQRNENNLIASLDEICF